MTNSSVAIPRNREAYELLTNEKLQPVLLRGAIIVSMDPDVGDFEQGDVLLRGGEVVAVGLDLADDYRSAGATWIDCRGLILAPGFHDTHRHAWQGQIRRFLADADLTEYMNTMHFGMAHHYLPEDMYAGSLVTGLGAIDAGITTVMDFSHNTRTAAHSDAAIAGWIDSGLRAVHASAAPVDGNWDKHWPQDLERVADNLPPSGLVTLRMALFPQFMNAVPDYVELSAKNVQIARGLGLQISVDAVVGTESSETLLRLQRESGVLGSDLTYIHCTDLTDDAWRVIADTGGTISLSPSSDAHIGLGTGVTPVQKCIDHGVAPTLSADIESELPTDMFTQMRTVLALQRMYVYQARLQNENRSPQLLSSTDALAMATINGARANGLGDVCGSISPGKQADIIAIRTDDVNMFPLTHVYGAIVQGADSRNIEFVLIAGRPVKWQRKVTTFDLSEANRIAGESRDRVLSAAGFSHGGVFRSSSGLPPTLRLTGETASVT